MAGEDRKMPPPGADPRPPRSGEVARELSVPEDQAPTAEEQAARRLQREAEAERARPLTRELVEYETAAEGIAGAGRGQSGTLPGSVGGTTGTAGRSAGIQTPGATVPTFPGISPERARRLREQGRRKEKEGKEEEE
jgi:hypothetical protein